MTGYPEEECEFAYQDRCDTWKHECEHFIEDSCKYCRNEDFEDNVLLEFALKGLEMSRNDLIEAYRLSKENK